MKSVLLFALGIVIGVAISWPRTGRIDAPFVADGDSRIVHRNHQCEYTPMESFQSLDDAYAKGLKPCPVCIGERAKEVAQAEKQSPGVER